VVLTFEGTQEEIPLQASEMLRVLKNLTLVLLIGAAVGGAYLWQLYHWSQSPRPLSQRTILKVLPGVSLGELAKHLVSQGIIDSGVEFQLWVKGQRIFHRVQAGTYHFVDRVSPQQLLDALIAGPNQQDAIITLTIPEGYTLRQIIDKMTERGIGTSAQLWQLAMDRDFLAALGLKATNLEGFLYPATYYFYEEHPAPKEVFTAMVDEFKHRIPPQYEEKLAPLNINFYEALTIASLIEKETRLPEERPLIAEVIWRRLKAKIPLGVDAAVIYGSEDYEGSLTRLQLKNRENPYNTRVHRGLPPTPIASPTAASLAAVIAPSNQGFLYYVLLPGNEGKHHFAKTLKEHNIYVAKLLKAQAKK
jgi:UPF0755 protein